MNREEALQWLAVNVEEWPAQDHYPRVDLGTWWWVWNDESEEVILSDHTITYSVICRKDWIEAKTPKKPVGKRYHKFTTVSGANIYVDFEDISLVTHADSPDQCVLALIVAGNKIGYTTFYHKTHIQVTQETINAFIEAWEAYTG